MGSGFAAVRDYTWPFRIRIFQAAKNLYGPILTAEDLACFCQCPWTPRFSVLLLALFHRLKFPQLTITKVRNAPKYDQPLEWRPLKGRPFDTDEELQLVSVLGNVTEFENRVGHRYVARNWSFCKLRTRMDHLRALRRLALDLSDRSFLVCLLEDGRGTVGGD